MTDRRIDPRGVRPSTTNGDVLTTVAGVTAWSAPATLTPLVTVVAGAPGLVFDSDGQIVYTEVP